jgi:hypothetical protein
MRPWPASNVAAALPGFTPSQRYPAAQPEIVATRRRDRHWEREMAASSHRTLAALGAAVCALIVLALGAVPAWAMRDASSGGRTRSVTAPGAVTSSGGANVALIVGIVVAAIVVALAIGLIAWRGRGRSRMVVAASPAEAPAPVLTEVAQPGQDEESHDLPKAA